MDFLSPRGSKRVQDSTSNHQVSSEHSLLEREPSEQHAPKNSTSGGHSWWWWWEIASAVFSVACMVSIIGTLIAWHDKPLSKWTFSIAPNSLISVFTTLSKSALLVPIAEAISQLKWTHFERANYLSHLQVYDRASRGPWGALRLIWTMNIRATIASFGALLVVVSLAFEPTVQQVVTFPERPTSRDALGDEAFVGVASMFDAGDHAFNAIGLDPTIVKMSNQQLKLRSALMGGVYGAPTDPLFVCPSSESCEWNTFTSLSICGRCQDVTSLAKSSCRTIEFDRIFEMCDYSFELDGLQSVYNVTTFEDGRDDVGPDDDPTRGLRSLTTLVSSQSLNKEQTNSNPHLGGFFSVKRNSGSSNVSDNSKLANITISLCTLTWCAQRHEDVSTTNGTLLLGQTKNYAINAENPLDQQAQILSLGMSDNSSDFTFPSGTTNASFNISRAGHTSLSAAINALFTVNVTEAISASIEPEEGVGALGLGTILFETNPAVLIDNIALSLSNVVRGPGNKNISRYSTAILRSKET